MSPYAMSKHMTELMLEDYKEAYGLNYISTRYFNSVKDLYNLKSQF